MSPMICPLLPINQKHISWMVYRLPHCSFSHEQSDIEPLEKRSNRMCSVIVVDCKPVGSLRRLEGQFAPCSLKVSCSLSSHEISHETQFKKEMESYQDLFLLSTRFTTIWDCYQVALKCCCNFGKNCSILKGARHLKDEFIKC